MTSPGYGSKKVLGPSITRKRPSPPMASGTPNIATSSGSYHTQVLFATIDADTIGDTTIVASAGSKSKIHVITYLLTAAGNEVLTWKDTGGKLLSGPIDLSKGIPITIATDRSARLFSTNAGEGLVVNLTSGGVQIGGHLSYLVEAGPDF